MFYSIPTLVSANTREYEKKSTIEFCIDAAINLIG